MSETYASFLEWLIHAGWSPQHRCLTNGGRCARHRRPLHGSQLTYLPSRYSSWLPHLLSSGLKPLAGSLVFSPPGMFIKTFTGRFLPRWAKRTPVICCTSQNVGFISPACLCSSIFTSLFKGKAKVAPIREWLDGPRRSQLEIIYWCVKEISWQHHARTLRVLPRVIRHLSLLSLQNHEEWDGRRQWQLKRCNTNIFHAGVLVSRAAFQTNASSDGWDAFGWSTNEKAWSQYNNTHWR